MKPDRGPVRETRCSAVVNPLEGAPPGFLVASRVGTPIAKAPDNVSRRKDFKIGGPNRSRFPVSRESTRENAPCATMDIPRSMQSSSLYVRVETCLIENQQQT